MNTNSVLVSLESHGAQFLVSLLGEPQDVARTVNRFFNFGVCTQTGVPEDYKEGEHASVTLRCTKGDFQRGIHTMHRAGIVHAHLSSGAAYTLPKARLLKKLADNRARLYIGTFERVTADDHAREAALAEV